MNGATGQAIAQNGRIGLSPRRPLKIAIASSGLGHVARGVESWARDLAPALRRAGQDVTLFQGGGIASEPWQTVIPCWHRESRWTQVCVRSMRRFGGWRIGLGSSHQAEEATFSLGLWRKIRKDYDILHAGDAWLALTMERLWRAGWSRPRVILAHSTEEQPDVLRRFSNLQYLAPCQLEDWQPHKPAGQLVAAIPYFVDTSVFCPGDRRAARAALNLPQDDFIVLSVAALKKTHKRIDYLVREFARFKEQYAGSATLVLAGAREPETDEIIALARDLLKDRVRLHINVPRERMQTFYQAADLLAVASLHEVLGLCALEALASGLPVVCNSTPTLTWVVGRGGRAVDIRLEGALAGQLAEMSSASTRERYSREARQHAEAQFSERAVVQQVLAMYQEVSGEAYFGEKSTRPSSVLGEYTPATPSGKGV